MKKNTQIGLVAVFLVLQLFCRAVAFAQGTPAGPGANSYQWYQSPWLWISAVLAFIILLSLVFSSGRRRHRRDA